MLNIFLKRSLLLILFFGLFQTGFSTDLGAYNQGISKINNPNESVPYQNFLDLLKENYIINIEGIRNDSTIQYMSINLKQGNVVDGKNGDASLLFRVNQETIEDIFKKGGNLGQSFFENVVSGEIMMNKLDNRGVFESVGDWFGGLFSDKKELNLSVSCPSVYSPVCGVDNVTYNNGCLANNAGVEIEFSNSCDMALSEKNGGTSCYYLSGVHNVCENDVSESYCSKKIGSTFYNAHDCQKKDIGTSCFYLSGVHNVCENDVSESYCNKKIGSTFYNAHDCQKKDIGTSCFYLSGVHNVCENDVTESYCNKKIGSTFFDVHNCGKEDGVASSCSYIKVNSNGANRVCINDVSEFDCNTKLESTFYDSLDCGESQDIIGSCLYLDSNNFNQVCKNNMAESVCSKKEDSKFYEDLNCNEINDSLYLATKGINWKLNNSEVLIHDSFKLSNKSDVLLMFKTVMDARDQGKVAENIWDSFGVGDRIKDRINVDGSIDIGSFVNGNLAGGFGRGDSSNLGIGSNFGNNKNRVGSELGSGRGSVGDPTGTGLNPSGDSGFMGDGFGNSYNTGMGSGSNYGGTGSTGGASGAYDGQMGGDSGYGDTSGVGAGAMGAGAAGGAAGAEPVWSVDARDSSYQHSGSGGYSSFTHHSSTVSNDQGYSSTSDKQAFIGEDGTTITRVVVTQTDSNGNSKTSATTTKTDSDGNTETTQIITEKNSDGEVTSQTVSNDPPKDGSDSGCQPATEEYDNPRVPPSDAEKQSAVGRALSNSGLAGGSPIGANGAVGYDVGDFNPDTVGCTDDGCTQKSVGGKINGDKLNSGNIDPTGVNR